MSSSWRGRTTEPTSAFRSKQLPPTFARCAAAPSRRGGRRSSRRSPRGATGSGISRATGPATTRLNARIRQIAVDLRITLVDAFTAFMDYPASSGGYTALLFDGRPSELDRLSGPGRGLVRRAEDRQIQSSCGRRSSPPSKRGSTRPRPGRSTSSPGRPIRSTRRLALKGYWVYRKPAAGGGLGLLPDRLGIGVGLPLRGRGPRRADQIRLPGHGPVPRFRRERADGDRSSRPCRSSSRRGTRPSGRFPASGGGIGKKINVVTFERESAERQRPRSGLSRLPEEVGRIRRPVRGGRLARRLDLPGRRSVRPVGPEIPVRGLDGRQRRTGKQEERSRLEPLEFGGQYT